MARTTEASKGQSKYALKVRGIGLPTVSNTKQRRRCDQCKQTLAGKRGHGFPGTKGHGIYCGGCRFS